jgi:hypothetical protein
VTPVCLCCAAATVQNAGIAIAAVGGAGLLAAFAGLFLWLRHRRRQRRRHSSSSSSSSSGHNPFAGLRKPLTSPNGMGGGCGPGGYDPALMYNNRAAATKDPGLHQASHSTGSSKGLQPTWSAGAAAAAGGGPAQTGLAVGALAGGAAGGAAMAVGFTGDELQGCMKDLKYVMTNRLLPAVDNASLAVGELPPWVRYPAGAGYRTQLKG